MAQPSFSPVPLAGEVRPVMTTGTPEIGRLKKPGMERSAIRAEGTGYGTPAPGEGYALTIADARVRETHLRAPSRPRRRYRRRRGRGGQAGQPHWPRADLGRRARGAWTTSTFAESLRFRGSPPHPFSVSPTVTPPNDASVTPFPAISSLPAKTLPPHFTSSTTKGPHHEF